MVVTKILYEGIYRGIRFKIISSGSHPCAYVGFPIGHIFSMVSHIEDVGAILKCKEIKKMNLTYDAFMNDIDVHGGLTFSKWGDGTILEKEYFWYGWDYCHYMDYTEYFGLSSDIKSIGRKWKTKEIFEHCLDAVNDFKKLELKIDIASEELLKATIKQEVFFSKN